MSLFVSTPSTTVDIPCIVSNLAAQPCTKQLASAGSLGTPAGTCAMHLSKVQNNSSLSFWGPWQFCNTNGSRESASNSTSAFACWNAASVSHTPAHPVPTKQSQQKYTPGTFPSTPSHIHTTDGHKGTCSLCDIDIVSVRISSVRLFSLHDKNSCRCCVVKCSPLLAQRA